ncbi:SSI family serine proteinase inhibitor [Actinokineospora fastidiosa]|uniref:Subtilisin inhibitor domain-containing protein n=1 Tax=Actinokineospora fastidiosa TaxID=1816 RepID=A0A918GV12_9PSEU|nr:SSI family serine proteinase inhibitor [Actinokineospora fastidiosa]GGS60186.1 hypothetical protein GCM10010171_63920 [Actinokineospora fastidiosa]
MFRILAATASMLVAAAVPALAESGPEVRLALSVTYYDNTFAVGSLSCSPIGGQHRNPEGACAELYGASGDIAAADREMTRVCPMHYEPVTVRAVGWYGDGIVDYTRTYGNSCVFANSAGQLWNI